RQIPVCRAVADLVRRRTSSFLRLVLRLPPRLSPFFFFLLPRPPPYTVFPYTTLFRSSATEITAFPRVSDWFTIHSRNCRCSSGRSEEHTSELQSRFDIVCRLLLEKKNTARGRWRASDLLPALLLAVDLWSSSIVTVGC